MAIPKKLIPVLLLTVFALVGYWLLTTPTIKPVVVSVYEPAMIEAHEQEHNLGNVNTDDKAVHTFYLYNVGGKRLDISKVDTSCGCTVTELSKKSISPGDFAALKVTLDTSIKIGKVNKKITVFSNDAQHPQLALYLKGNVMPRMKGHERIAVKDPLVLFKGKCASCHVDKGKGKSGKALFQADCAMCHGLNAQGAVAPSLLKGNYENEAFLAHARRVIAEGAPNNPEMPPFSTDKGGPLSDSEIDSLVTFLQYRASLGKQGLLRKDGSSSLDDDEEEM